LCPIAAGIGHLVRDDQMVLGIDGDLDMQRDRARSYVPAAGSRRCRDAPLPLPGLLA
jgi:hypothetical protein